MGNVGDHLKHLQGALRWDEVMVCWQLLSNKCPTVEIDKQILNRVNQIKAKLTIIASTERLVYKYLIMLDHLNVSYCKQKGWFV